MQIVQSSVILIKGRRIQFESFYEDMHCLICELKASFKFAPFIFLGGSEYVGRKMRAFQIMLMKLNDCNLPYCEEKLLAGKDEDRIKILPWLAFDLKTAKISLGSYLWKPSSQPDEISFKRFYSCHGYLLALME